MKKHRCHGLLIKNENRAHPLVCVWCGHAVAAGFSQVLAIGKRCLRYLAPPKAGEPTLGNLITQVRVTAAPMGGVRTSVIEGAAVLGRRPRKDLTAGVGRL